MSLRTTYPNQFGGPGKTLTDFGIFEETFQGYAQIPALPTASVTILDLESPNPASPNPLVITSSVSNIRSVVSITGAVLTAPGGSDILLSGIGTIRVAPATGGLTFDGTAGFNGLPFCATPRTPAGALVLGTTILRNSVLTSGGPPNAGFQNPLSSRTTNDTFTLFGCTNDTNASTGLNISSSNPAKPAIVFVTIRTLCRKWRVQTIVDYPTVSKAVQELLQISI